MAPNDLLPTEESDLVLQLRRLPCFRHTRRAFHTNIPTRTRTRNPSVEARDDFHFTIGAKAEGKGFEPSSLDENRVSGAARSTVSGYLPYLRGPTGS